MKKVLLGAGAIALAVASVAFKNMPKKASFAQGTYYFAVTATLGITTTPSWVLQTSPSVFGCVGFTHFCAAAFTGNFCTTAGGRWVPTILTALLGEKERYREN